MTGMNGVGTSGSSADHDGMNYPAVPYGSGDFHRASCTCSNGNGEGESEAKGNGG
jgi:alpha-amylase